MQKATLRKNYIDASQLYEVIAKVKMFLFLFPVFFCLVRLRYTERTMQPSFYHFFSKYLKPVKRIFQAFFFYSQFSQDHTKPFY